MRAKPSAMSKRQVARAPQAAFDQAVALAHEGDRDAAEEIFRAILKLHPKDFATLYNLAALLLQTERFEAAVELLERAVRQEPNSAEARSLLASALHNSERYDAALESASRALALKSDFVDPLGVVAESSLELGRYDDARSAVARAIELAPERPYFYHRWGYVARWRRDDPRFVALETLGAKAQSFPPEERIYLHFALGKAYADCGEIERSFRHQLEGAALKRKTVAFDEALVHRQWDDLCRTFDAEFLGRSRGVGNPSPLPVLIFGMPRSGTTLIEQVLASHPKVRALGERQFFNDALGRIRGKPGAPRQSAVSLPWSNDELRRLGALYLEALRRGAPAAAERVTDKVTGNFRFAGLVHAALPNARLIHTRRDPIDTCLSMFSLLFSGVHQPFSYDLGELGRHYLAYEKLMAHWRSILPEGVMLEVRYEDLIDDFERQARRIVAHCALDWDDACLEFHKSDRPVRTASHAQVRQPIYRTSIGRARPPRELILPLLNALGLDEASAP